MRISDEIVLKILKDSGKVTPEKIESLVSDSKKEHKPLQEIVTNQQVINEAALAEKYGAMIGVQRVSLADLKIDKTVLKLIPERVARKYRAILFDVENDIPKIAMEDPDDLQAIDFIQKLLGQSLQVYIATTKDIAVSLESYKDSLTNEITKTVEKDGVDGEISSQDNQDIDEQDIDEDSPIAKTVTLLVEYAIKSKASDIHIEPRENIQDRRSLTRS